MLVSEDNMHIAFTILILWQCKDNRHSIILLQHPQKIIHRK